MNNKGADQTAWMRRLTCAFVVHMWHKTHFLMARLKWYVYIKYHVIFSDMILVRLQQKYQQKWCRISPVLHKWARAWQNQQNGMCAQQRLRSAWHLLCTLHSHGPKALSSIQQKQIRLHGYIGWTKSAGCSCDFVGFILLWLSCVSLMRCQSSFQHNMNGAYKQSSWKSGCNCFQLYKDYVVFFMNMEIDNHIHYCRCNL